MSFADLTLIILKKVENRRNFCYSKIYKSYLLKSKGLCFLQKIIEVSSIVEKKI